MVLLNCITCHKIANNGKKINHTNSNGIKRQSFLFCDAFNIAVWASINIHFKSANFLTTNYVMHLWSFNVMGALQILHMIWYDMIIRLDLETVQQYLFSPQTLETGHSSPQNSRPTLAAIQRQHLLWFTIFTNTAKRTFSLTATNSPVLQYMWLLLFAQFYGFYVIFKACNNLS